MQGEVTRPSAVEAGEGPLPMRGGSSARRCCCCRRQIANHEAFPLDTSFLDKEKTKSGVSCQTICTPLMYRLGCHDY